MYIKTNDVGYLEDERGETILDCFCSLDEFALTNFELIENNNIDIDSIEEKIIDKINELVQAVKQLNKEIKSIKEK